MTNEQLDVKLAECAEPGYRDFTARLTPTGYAILGVRIPLLRKLAAEAPPPADIVPDSFEKVMVRGFATARQKLPIDEYLDGAEAFLPLIDNWAVCDCFTSSLKSCAKHLPTVYERFVPLKDGGEWQRRFLAVLLMDYFLTDWYIDAVLDVYRDMKQGEYYVDMAIAWGLSVALVKYYDKTYARLQAKEYSAFVTNKAISKARDSYRIPPERKAALLLLKKK